MSKYLETQTVMTDQRHLVAALKEMGYAAEVNAKPVTLYGYHGDERPEKAEIVVRRSQISRSANDIGFTKGADGSGTI